jgi:hypothetical protein
MKTVKIILQSDVLIRPVGASRLQRGKAGNEYVVSVQEYERISSWAKIVNEDVEDPYGENKSKNKKYDVPNKKDSDKKGK